MKTHFKLTGDLNIEIMPDSVPESRLVSLRFIRGVDYDIHQTPFTPLAVDSQRKMEVLLLSKAEARSIASALMGCAAEV